MRFGSVCSGIEAASVAFAPLNWTAAWFSEVDAFPSALLAHHYPDIPNHGDMQLLPDAIAFEEVEAPDLLCGGTPCQAFSVAGLRQSLDDDRGNLTLVFCEIANAIDEVRADRGEEPCVILWENVPGVLNTKDNAFGCFLAALCGEDEPLQPAGKKWTHAGCVFGPKRAVAWRILDAQYFGLAQRRRRVFVVASAREGFDPGAVLFESDGLRRDFAPVRETGEGAAACLGASSASSSSPNVGNGQGTVVEVCGTLTARGVTSFGAPEVDGGMFFPAPKWTDEVAPTLRAGGNRSGGDRPPGTDVDTVCSNVVTETGMRNAVDVAHTLRAQAQASHRADTDTYVAHTLRGEGFDASEDGTGRGTPLVPVAFHAEAQADQLPTAGRDTSIPDALTCSQRVAVAFAENSRAEVRLEGGNGETGVRRLTPRECERLQGFPDFYTAIPWRGRAEFECPDGPRYKSLGNSWAINCVRWIGERIQLHLEGLL